MAYRSCWGLNNLGISVGFRNCHIEIIRSTSKSFSSYCSDTYRIVHHEPHDVQKQQKKSSSQLRTFHCTLLQRSYTPSKPSSALPIDNPHQNFRSPLLLLLFSPRAAVRLLPRVAWSSIFSDVTKRQLYHRVLNCTSVVIPGRLYPLKYYSPLQYGNGRAEGEDRTYRGFGGRTLGGMRFLGRSLVEGRGKGQDYYIVARNVGRKTETAGLPDAKPRLLLCTRCTPERQ